MHRIMIIRTQSPTAEHAAKTASLREGGAECIRGGRSLRYRRAIDYFILHVLSPTRYAGAPSRSGAFAKICYPHLQSRWLLFAKGFHANRHPPNGGCRFFVASAQINHHPGGGMKLRSILKKGGGFAKVLCAFLDWTQAPLQPSPSRGRRHAKRDG